MKSLKTRNRASWKTGKNKTIFKRLKTSQDDERNQFLISFPDSWRWMLADCCCASSVHHNQTSSWEHQKRGEGKENIPLFDFSSHGVGKQFEWNHCRFIIVSWKSEVVYGLIDECWRLAARDWLRKQRYQLNTDKRVFRVSNSYWKPFMRLRQLIRYLCKWQTVRGEKLMDNRQNIHAYWPSWKEFQ